MRVPVRMRADFFVAPGPAVCTSATALSEACQPFSAAHEHALVRPYDALLSDAGVLAGRYRISSWAFRVLCEALMAPLVGVFRGLSRLRQYEAAVECFNTVARARLQSGRLPLVLLSAEFPSVSAPVVFDVKPLATDFAVSLTADLQRCQTWVAQHYPEASLQSAFLDYPECYLVYALSSSPKSLGRVLVCDALVIRLLPTSTRQHRTALFFRTVALGYADFWTAGAATFHKDYQQVFYQDGEFVSSPDLQARDTTSVCVALSRAVTSAVEPAMAVVSALMQPSLRHSWKSGPVVLAESVGERVAAIHLLEYLLSCAARTRSYRPHSIYVTAAEAVVKLMQSTGKGAQDA